MKGNIVSGYIDRFRHDHHKRMVLRSVLFFLGIAVAIIVYWQLRGTGISMTNETFCGIEEHTHTDDCYEYILVCGYDDTSEAVNSTEAHVHTDDCYEPQLVCGLEEHTHTAECLIDLTADVEDASVWKATLPELSGDLRSDIVSIAYSQLGYTESAANYELGEDETTHYGYTRYGAWYGNEYGDWDAMFVAFCLNYAGIDEEEFPTSSGAYAWVLALSKAERYADAADYTPVAGDIVFFDTDGDDRADRVGIVTGVDETEDTATADEEADEENANGETVGTIMVIEGNYTVDETDCVCKNTYSLTDESIVGYGMIPEQEIAEEDDNADTEEASEDGTADTDTDADGDTDTTTLEYIGDDYIVTVTYGEDAELPENVALWVYEYLQESGTYITRYAEAAELYGWDEDGSDDSDDSDDSNADDDTDDSMEVRLFNISFVDESGIEIEPAAAVQVTIAYLNQETESESYTITHFSENGTETIEAETEYEDGTQTISFGLESFSEIMLTAGFNPGPGPSGPGTSTGDPSEAIYVWYDRVTVTTNNGKETLTSAYDTADEGIKSVTLDEDSVPHGDSDDSSYANNSTGGLQITTPYATSGKTVSIVVTPQAGYYITFICITCCSNGSAATGCQSYQNGEAYKSSFSISSTGAVTITVTLDAEDGFKHDSGATNYFILIAVSSIPSPLYVEYDYGDIVTYITNSSATDDSSAFSTADGWTATSDGNYYGNGYNDSNVDTRYMNGTYTGYGVMTDDTQYKYAYEDGSESEAAKWVHNANTITDKAKEQAAAAGYIFAGWAAEYYTTVTVAKNTNQNTTGYQSSYNNWTYTYDTTSSYGSATYEEGAAVTLTTNVRMVAQWIPIGITVTKKVEGLSGTEYASENHTYTLRIQVAETDSNGTILSWSDYSTASFTISGDGTANTTIYPLPAGIYRVTETGGNSNLSGTNYTYYISVDTGGNVTVDYSDSTSYTETEVDDDSGGTITVALLNDTLTVVNSYTTTPVTVTVILEKVDDSSPANTLSGAVFELYDSTANSTKTLDETGSDGTVELGSLTVGSSYTLTETTAPDGYSLLSESISFTVTSASSLTITEWTNASTPATCEVDSNGNIIITVVNTTNPEMPNTGGEGDGRFHLFGASLILLSILGLSVYKHISEMKLALADGVDESIYRPPKSRSPNQRKWRIIIRGMPKRGESRAGPDG